MQVERSDRWSTQKEKQFLTVLAVTSNVRLALREVGMSPASLYFRRRKHPGFEAAWDHALNEGYAKLEADMLARAMNEPGSEDDCETSGPAMADSTKLTLLAAHAKRVGQYRAAQTSMVAVDTARLRREITQRLDRLARSLGLEVIR